MLLNYVRNEKEAHFRIRLEKQNDGAQPVGDPLREGRPDRLLDLCLYFIPPQVLLTAAQITTCMYAQDRN